MAVLASLPPTLSASDGDLACALDGAWRFQSDRQNVGVGERWFTRALPEHITLPGSMPGAGKGEAVTPQTKWVGSLFDRAYFTDERYAPYREPGHVKVPFWLQPETYYAGPAWYQRDVDIPAAWAGRRIVLSLERPHWHTRVWLDERELGTGDALSVPHRFELGGDVSPGRHQLTVRVDNTFDPDIGENSHSMSDHTQGNWNGIVGRIELVATPPVWIDDVQVYPHAGRRTVEVRGRIGHGAGQSLPERVDLAVDAGPAGSVAVADDGSFATMLSLAPDAARWDEFHPALHALEVSLANGERRTVRFGLRDFRADGGRLSINGRPVFLRGTLDCAAYPRTGHPPMDEAEWRRFFGVIQAHGLNHVRFHSWCPPEAAFAVADELGLYLQVEVASWPNWSTTLGDGKPVDAWLDAETERIRRAYGNHPSFVMLCAGNEPGGERFAAWLARWVERQKAEDPRRLYTAGAGWPELPENDYQVLPEPRIQQWGAGLRSRINALPPATQADYGDFIRARRAPVVSHEIGQWCVYPNFAETGKYTGYLKPRNFEIFRATLEEHGLGAQAHDFLIASGKLQALCYKEEIESALRTPGMGGFQLLGLSDFPGQGTALVGVLDVFWEEKGYISPAEFRRFCGATVPLARLEKRVFTADEHLVAEVEVAHYGEAARRGVAATWTLRADDGRTAAHGTFPPRDLAVGARNVLGRIDLPLETLAAPARYRLVVSVDAEAGQPAAENDWSVWVYPRAETVATAAAPELLVSATFDAATEAKVEAGATAVLLIPPERVASDPQRGPISLGFSSIFWNTAWTNGQAPHTLGILCDPGHPALAGFPTEAWSDWQWWYPVSHAAPLRLDDLPRELRPIVQVIDDWVTARKLGLVFEARLGRGRLLVTSINLVDPVLDPVRRQLRASLLGYAASPRCQPTTTITAEQVRGLIAR